MMERVVKSIPCISVGTARLPKSIGGTELDVLAIELAIDTATNEILGVASTFPLPSYVGVLQRILVGRRLEEAGALVQSIAAHIRGPLLRPTQAAVLSAAANFADGE